MSRLRFTNLGETGATGGDKGIWGRLGEIGRPSYAALDFTLAESRRLIAGVHLERKGEPSVEPTPFIVTGLAPDVRLQDLMLLTQGDREAVPELTELRENAVRLGGKLQIFPTARDYFAALFDQGVMPLRLGTDEERNKLNEMLRTSMTGGISRVLTSELRSFLLKEESGLADTLQRMKANLDACRRTRTEVQESQRLEREIGGVFEAGQTMFAAAFLATRERAEELRRRVAESEAARATALETLQDAATALRRVRDQLEAVEAGRAEIDNTLQSAREWLRRLQNALAALQELKRRRRELEGAIVLERAVAEERARAEATRDVRRLELRRAQDDYRRAAEGLADLQQGLEELHRRADAHRQVVRRRDQAQTLLCEQDLSVARLPSILERYRAELEEVDSARRAGALTLADAETHRREHGLVLAALQTIVGAAVDVASAHGAAIGALREQRELQILSSRAPAMSCELEEARKQASRQGMARERAQGLGVSLGVGLAGERIRALLEDAETQRELHEAGERTARGLLADVERSLRELNARGTELMRQEAEWRELDARARRIEQSLGASVGDRVDLEQARKVLAERLDSARKRESQLKDTLERTLAEARELLAAGGPFDAELLRLKDELAADLLASSFDEIELEEAGPLEARLGPLVQALVVDDPGSAACTIAGRSADLSTVWLVARNGAEEAVRFGGPLLPSDSRDVVVKENSALRVSRIPSRPRLGRKARERRAQELRADAQACEVELEAVRVDRRALERLIDDGDALLAAGAVWLNGDPAPALVELRRTIVEAEAQIEIQRRIAERQANESRAIRPRIEALRGLLADAFLLDPPDHAERAERLDAEHRSAVAARSEVKRCAEPYRILDGGLDVLRHPPLSESEVEELRLRVEKLRQERDRLDAGIEAIEYVTEHVEALAWGEAEATLRHKEALVPALGRQLDESDSAVQAAEREASAAATAYDAVTSRWQDADGRRRVAVEQVQAAESRFHEAGIDEPTEEAERGGREEVARLETEQRDASKRISDLATEAGRRETSWSLATERLKEAEEKAESERREAEPAIERWERLRALALQHGLVGAVLAPGRSDVSGIRGHVQLVQEAHRQRAVLVERLRSAQGGAALLQQVEKPSASAEVGFGDTYLELWLLVRDWLRLRLPAQVAEVDDPREALLRLRDQLTGLEERLARQESDLRGASEDVARGIDVQIRKARGQVNRLNKHLDGVKFGRIERIRVRLEAVERMDQVLRALRDGAAQGLLFQADIPIEEALDEIFRRYGGGRMGGQRLLDYREYVHLQVEIRRSSGTDWEVANPTRVSTGEAIGVGAALMMVVLTEWERDANLVRGKRSTGSLRFLFLDEANRLSNDNLGVLFDLCQNLDLQLLIAAPEVARAEGNTTYHLARRTTADGREEVVVSGRRMRESA